jgi:hypothetical protein
MGSIKGLHNVESTWGYNGTSKGPSKGPNGAPREPQEGRQNQIWGPVGVWEEALLGPRGTWEGSPYGTPLQVSTVVAKRGEGCRQSNKRLSSKDMGFFLQNTI